jgi:hypothetical protein
MANLLGVVHIQEEQLLVGSQGPQVSRAHRLSAIHHTPYSHLYVLVCMYIWVSIYVLVICIYMY